MDEPNSAGHPDRPVLNCGHPNGTICDAWSTGDPSETYDGNPNTTGDPVCNIGGPYALNIDKAHCSRPNVFQGESVGPSVTQFQFALDPPGPNGFRIIRLTNLRVTPTTLSAPYTTAQVSFYITLGAGDSLITINNQQQIVAFVQTGLRHSVPSPGVNRATSSSVHIEEGFNDSFKARNASAYTGDHLGTPALADYVSSSYSYSYNGNLGDPADVAQNVPGAIYHTESGFQWQNNGDNRPPSPNPPQSIGTIPVQDNGGPLTNSHNLSQAGVADAGTQIQLKFTGTNPKYPMSLPTVVYLTRGTQTTGVMVLRETDSAARGSITPNAQVSALASSYAIYEVLYADPFSLEAADIPVELVHHGKQLPGNATVQVSVEATFAPAFSSVNDSTATPRFKDTSVDGPQVLFDTVRKGGGPNH